MANTKKKLTPKERQNTEVTHPMRLPYRAAVKAEAIRVNKIIDARLEPLLAKLDALLKPPVEEVKEPKFKVGDVVTYCASTPRDVGTGVITSLAIHTAVVSWSSCYGNSTEVYESIRPATTEEITKYEQEKEASRKAEQEASKLSKLKFGVKVKTPQGEGFYHYHDGDKEINAPHWVVFPSGYSDCFPLSDITIVG